MDFRKILTALAAAVAATAFTGCSDDDPTDAAVIYDIARLKSQDDSGAVFTLQKPQAPNAVTLTSKQFVDTAKVPVGDRLLIAYSVNDAEPYQTASITLKGYALVVNGTLKRESTQDLEDWDKTPVYLMSAWVSDGCLNIQASLPYDTNPRRFALVTDSTATLSARPDLYLAHAIDGYVNTFNRSYYASFDISALTSDPAVEGFTLHLNNSNLRLDEISFDFVRADAE